MEKWVEENTILLGKTGSHAYGTNIETSDVDYKGICIPPVEYFLGLNSFDGYDKTGGKNYKNTQDDIDITILHINKFVRDAMAGVPNNLELLFLDEYITLDKFGKELVDMREEFISKQIIKKYGGYAKSQAKRMVEYRPNKGRNELVDEYGYDTKFFMHTIRLLQTGTELLETGTMTTKRKNAEELIELRKGKYSLDDAVKYIEDWDNKLYEAYKYSAVRENVDKEKINKWLVDFNMRRIKG